MNTNTEPVRPTVTSAAASRSGSRIQGVLDDVFGPVLAPAGTVERRLLVARSVVAYLGLLTTLVQVVVWLSIGAVTGDLDSPWWLWTTVPAVAAVAAMTAARHWHRWWRSASTQEASR